MACAFHGYTPNPTLVDTLLATEQVMLARPLTSNPTHLAPVASLMGHAPATVAMEVHPADRTRLLQSDGESLLLARDGAYGPWVNLGVIDQRLGNILRHVLSRHAAWQAGSTEDRVRFFAGLVNDPDPNIRRLALQELDRAPYATLRKIDMPRLPTLQADLTNPDNDLTPIRILLAGLSQDQSYRALLASRLADAVHTDTAVLGAYATALIELGQEDAVTELLQRHVHNPALTLETRTKLLNGLALQYKVAPLATRRAITQGVAELVREAPGLSDVVERQFGFRKSWFQARQGTGRVTLPAPDSDAN